MKNFDWIIFFLLLLLMFSGVFFIYSASSTKVGNVITTENYYLKQILWIIISIIMLFILQKIPYNIIDIFIVPLYIFSLILLVLALFFPQVKGSHRWIQLGFMNFQASELAKLSLILIIAKFLSKSRLSEIAILRTVFLFSLGPIILILMEPDLGTALTIIFSIFAILAVSDLPFFYLILFISPLFSIITSFSLLFYCIFIVALILILLRINLSKVVIGFTVVINSFFFFITPIIWNNLKTYQQERILSFINPMHSPFGSGYQIIQSKIAIGSGGLLGKGFLSGTQKNLNFLPEHHTDFIFSVVGEEFGFLGCMFLLLFLFLFLFRISNRILSLNRKVFRYAAVGMLAYLFFQIVVNVGMNIGIMPTTGIPLPFISYGGSNLLINVLAVGLILKFINEKSIFS